jgi:hypothetical protein
MITDELMDKISKIQALAKGGTRGEAEVAAAKLSELMARHNISLFDLDKYADGKGRSVKEKIFWLPARSNWRRELMNQVARANNCRVSVFSGTSAVNIFGHDHNIIVTIETYTWLESIFDDLVKREREMLKYRTWQRGPVLASSFEDYFNHDRRIQMYEMSRNAMIRNRQKWSNSFRFGMVSGMAKAMQDARTKVRNEVGENRWALIPVIEQEVEDYVDSQNIEERKVKINQDRAASIHGFQVGKSINTDRQIHDGGDILAIRG